MDFNVNLLIAVESFLSSSKMQNSHSKRKSARNLPSIASLSNTTSTTNAFTICTINSSRDNTCAHASNAKPKLLSNLISVSKVEVSSGVPSLRLLSGMNFNLVLKGFISSCLFAHFLVRQATWANETVLYLVNEYEQIIKILWLGNEVDEI